MAIARVLQAGYTGEAGPDWKPWTGTVRVERVVNGFTPLIGFTIGRSGSTAACDDGIGPPIPGDLWALYIGKRNGRTVLVNAYPLELAVGVDPKLSGDRLKALLPRLPQLVDPR